MPTDDSSSPDRASWTPSEIGLAIGSVLLITLVAFEELAATTIMPAVVASFDAAAWYPIASGAALATQLSATVVAGALADWKGPRFVLLAGLVLFAVGLVVCAVGTNVVVFVVGRAAGGGGGRRGLVSMAHESLQQPSGLLRGEGSQKRGVSKD